jgi:hypothetical protein
MISPRDQNGFCKQLFRIGKIINSGVDDGWVDRRLVTRTLPKMHRGG